jgi:hypothetical protein
MQAGLSRAIPSGILGFMVGALLVIVLRGLQGLEPLWASGTGIVISAIFTAAFFIWGMGAFDPRLSVHGEHEAAAHEELAEEAAQPRSLLVGSTWMIITVTTLVFVALLGLAALPGGLALIQTVQPGASLTMVGYATVPLPFGGQDIVVSTFVLFALFVLWAFLSLGLVAAGLGFGFVALHRGLIESQAQANGTLALPAGEAAPKRPSRSVRETLTTFTAFIVTYIVAFLVASLLIGMILTQPLPILVWMFDVHGQVMLLSVIAAAIVVRLAFGAERFKLVAPFVFAFVFLYFFFYYVAIGLILPEPNLPILSLFLTNPQQLAFLSFTNAFIFALLILYPTQLLQWVGIGARVLAKVLRSVPRFLQ